MIRWKTIDTQRSAADGLAVTAMGHENQGILWDKRPSDEDRYAEYLSQSIPPEPCTVLITMEIGWQDTQVRFWTAQGGTWQLQGTDSWTVSEEETS